MENYNYRSKLLKHLVSCNAFEGINVGLIDVGASGGISGIWNQFSHCLNAYGFDPLLAEIDRLNSEQIGGGVEYIAAWLSTEDRETLAGVKGRGYHNNYSVKSTSATRAERILGLDYKKTFFNNGCELKFTDVVTTVDSFVSSRDIDVDFIKIDTDGHDYFVLDGAKRSLEDGKVLGVQVECQFHGSKHPHASIFSNIDLFLRKRGFTLYELECWHYTKEDLPGEFVYDIPAQTKGGQIQWGDALYFFDPFSEADQFNKLFEQGRKEKLLKLMVLFDAFGQGDSAARLIHLLMKKNINIENINYLECLDCLVPKNRFNIGSYQEYISLFESSPEKFYPEC